MKLSNKNKFSLSVLAIFLALLTVVPQALALEIRVTSDGRIIFYEDSVLGTDDTVVRGNRGSGSFLGKVIKSVSPSERKELRIKTADDRLKIGLRSKKNRTDSDFVQTEDLESDRVRLRFLSSDLSEREKQEKGRRDSQLRQEYLSGVKDERKQRKDEFVELRNQFKEQKQQLILESRNIKAGLSRGAIFTLDPATNEVTIVTPSGQEHTLVHLPDQAIERMQNAGKLSLFSEGDEPELDVVTTQDGEVQYKVRSFKRKKLFGLFNRNVPTEVVLNDGTGDVEENEVQTDSVIQDFLNSVSF